MSISLDGYVAPSDGSADWIAAGRSDDALAWTLIHFLWQGALLALAAFVALRVIRPERATTRYAIGVGTLALMLTSAIVTFAMLSRAPQPSIAVRAAASITPPSTVTPIAAASFAKREYVSTEGSHSIDDVDPSAIAAWRPTTRRPAAPRS